MRKILVCIGFMILVSGCEKKVSWPVTQQNSRPVVVDAILTGEFKNQKITLTFPVTELNAVPEPVTGANILVSDEDSLYTFTETLAGSGIYLSAHPFSAREGYQYSLYVYYLDKILRAKADMTPAKPFNLLVYAEDELPGMYHISWVASSFSSGSPAMWEVFLDWSKVSGYENTDPSNCKARLLFYTLPTLDVSEIFAPSVEKISFPPGTIINERRYSLSPGYADFIREMLLETSWQGGLFNSVPANAPTNLSSGAIGYFAACGVYEISVTVR